MFEEAFGLMPKIYMHDLTQNDIKTYAFHRLREHPRWPSLVTSNSAGGHWLINEIVERCDGVFLWVFLVTKLLREGMTNQDRFPDLRRRLESFPRELGPFFRQILDSVEPIYHAKTASLLRIALTAKKPLHMIMYDMHDLEHDDENYYRGRRIKPFTREELSDVKSRITYHLNSRTRGLLQVSSCSFEVTFLHRTVRDYLAGEGLSYLPKIDLPRGSGHKFSPELSILRAYAAWVKCSTPHTLRRNEFAEYSDPGNTIATDGITPSIVDITTDLIPYAKQLERQSPGDPRQDEVLDDIDSSIAALISRARSNAGSSSLDDFKDRLFEDYGICPYGREFQDAFAWVTNAFFRERLVKAGITNYVAAKELKEPSIGRSQTDQSSLTVGLYWWTGRTLLAHLRVHLFPKGLGKVYAIFSKLFLVFLFMWEVYAILFSYFLFLLFPFMHRLSSFLMKYLPSFLSRSVVVPFMSKLAEYAYRNTY